MIPSMATTVTGRRICLLRLLTRALKNNSFRLIGACLIFSPLFAQVQPVFRSEPVPAPLVERIRHTTWHPGCPVAPEDLRQLTLTYLGFDGQRHTGILLVNKDLAQETMRIFRGLLQHGFMIERMVPIEDYGGSDDASMAANNTSAFNCRDATGKPGVFSNHSWGRAIDINPLTNPYIKGDKVLPPEGRRYLDRSKEFKGSILKDG